MGRGVSIVFIIIILLLLFIRSPWGQDIIVGKFTNYISNKTHTEVSIDRLFITFSGKINVEGLYLEDQQGDTLVYSRQLEAAIPIWPIIKGEPISINRVEWNGLIVNVSRKDTIHGFNFQFLTEAFASDSTAALPETAQSEPLEIAIGSIHFSDFKVNYDDAVSGMKAHLGLGEFHFEGENFDLETMRFEISEIALRNTTLSYTQTKPSPQTQEDTAATVLPFLSVDNLKLQNVTLHYNSVPDEISADVHLADFLLQLPKADLANQEIEVGQFALNNSTIKVKTPEAASPQKADSTQSLKLTEAQPFAWPDWNVQVESIAFKNNHLVYQSGKPPENINGFNPDYINLNDFTLKVDNVELSKTQKLNAELTVFSFQEANGLTLKQLAFALNVNKQQLNIENFNIRFDNSSLAVNLSAQYQSIVKLINQPKNSTFTVDLNHFSLDLNDIFRLQPDLKTNEYLRKLSLKKINASIKAEGSLAQMNVPEFIAKWGEHTQIKMLGQFRNLMNADSLWIGIDNFSFQTLRQDIIALIPEDSLGISIPENIALNSQIHGGLNDLKTSTQLVTSDGGVQLTGNYKNIDEITFDAQLSIEDLELGKILENPKFAPITFSLNASGSGNSLNDLTAELSSEFSKLKYNGYDLSALQFSGNMVDGTAHINLAYKDQNLDLDLLSTVKIDSVSQNIAVDFNLNGADLKTLGLTNRALKARLLMTANVHLENGNIDLKSQIEEGTVVYDEETYHFGKVELAALLLQDSTSVDISSNFLNMKLRSNADMSHISSVIDRQISRYFSDSLQTPDSTGQPVRLQLDMDFHPNDLITEIFMPSIQSMDTLKVNVEFYEAKNLLTGYISLPHLDYAGNVIDSLGMKVNSTADAAEFAFGFKRLDAGAFVMNPTYFNGDLKEGVLELKFNSLNDKNEPFYVVKTQISGSNDSLKIHVVPDTLLLKGTPWQIPEDNQLLVQTDRLTAHNFMFSHNNQSVKIANDLIEVKKDNIGIGFENFSLSNIMALFNQDDYVADGNFQGNIVAVNPLGQLGFVADFGIDSLEVLQAPLGDLNLNANSEQENSYRFKMDLKGSDVDLDLQGNYVADASPHFNLNLAIKKFGFETIDKLSGESLERGSGYISGKLTANGAVTSPEYQGFIKFNDASLKVAQLNSTFYLTDSEIAINNEGIVFNNFSIADENQNNFSIDGSISTENITDPVFNLTLSADDFQLMNSTKNDSVNYYGTLNFDVNGTVTGPLSFPEVDLNIGINKQTNFTYVLSTSQAAMQSREGIVEFVNKANPENILTRNEDSTNVAALTGIQLHARINTANEAAFSVIVDPQTGDNLQISGESALDFNIARNGSMTLAGRYTVNEGHYKLTLFNLVNRQFYFQNGSTITWNGDPLGADLDVTAIYKLETSASGLMAAQMAGVSSEEQNKYKQVLPFWVLMNINGTIERPAISFDLTMPEDAQGAVGGAVYGRINQLDQNPSELNKQVFSLLVLNRFYPVPGSDGSQGGVASIARNNLNRLLSDQLNAFSDRLMGDTGVQLNFGLESYTDYQGQSAQGRTDLNITAQKNLFSDRLIVKAGTDVNVQGETRPGEENPLLGNVSIEYLLTKDGRWRLRGFRKNEYENVIDGQVYVNGLAVAFQYQFNHLFELWESIFGQEAGSASNENTVSTKDKVVRTNKN